MSQTAQNKRPIEKAADIIRDAGGKIVGRTRLQKIACLMELAGVGYGFSFEYHHYGPYSEELTHAIRDAYLIGLLNEEECSASWGGTYSVYTTDVASVLPPSSPQKILVQLAVDADPIELELAITAAFLGSQGEGNPWQETENRKSEKARDGRLERAKHLYEKFRAVNSPIPLPPLE